MSVNLHSSKGYSSTNNDVADAADDGADNAINNQEGTAASKTRVNASNTEIKMAKVGEDNSASYI